MDPITALLLFLHVAGAIVAFGPTFAFPIIGAMGGREPQHVNFALRLQKKISATIVTPLALLQGVTGLLLVWRVGFEILTRGWLLVSIALYITALIIAFGVLIPALRVLTPATSAPPPEPPPGGAPAGPPPHIVATIKRARIGGMVNAILVLIIVLLMVTKPF